MLFEIRPVALVLIALAGSVSVLDAQGTAMRDTTKRPLFTASDAWIVGAFAAGSAMMMPLDRKIATQLQRPRTQASRATRRAADAFTTLGSPGTLLVGAGMYGIGRLTHVERLADLGLHGTEAIVTAASITAVAKLLTGRQRPRYAGVDDPDDFAFAQGRKRGYDSYPSGHATAAFAAATVLTRETSSWWPGSTRFIAPLAYAAATMVGISRLYNNEHWASDVAMGAGVGTLTGLKVHSFNHRSPRNRVDRWLLGVVPTVSQSVDGAPGARVGWSMTVGGNLSHDAR